MKIDRKELLSALALVHPALDKKEGVEQSDSFAFFPDGIATYNDEISIFHPINVGIEGAIKGKELYALLGKVKEDELDLEIDGNQLVVYYGKKNKNGKQSEARIKLESKIFLPLSEMGMPSDWAELPAEACRAMEYCMFSCSSEKNKPLLQCVHLDRELAEATDNFRIMRYFLPDKELFPFHLILHASVVRVLIDYNPNEVSTTDGWAHFRNKDGTVFSCRVMNADEYPNLDKFLKAADGGDKVKLPDDIGAALDRAGVFSSNKECGRDANERVRITLSPGELVVFAEGAGGSVREPSDIDYDGPATEFEVNPGFLKAMLSKTTQVQVTKGLLKFSGDEFVHVISTLAPRKK